MKVIMIINIINLSQSVSDMIYNSRIKVQDAFFTPREIVLVLNDEDALKAYELLKPTITK